MKYILTDVEGTTTSISFVHDVLFPFSKERLKSFVERNKNKSEVKDIIASTIQTVLNEENKAINEAEACDTLLSWIRTDRKHAALKNLQGLIWQEGYESGEIKGHVYPDVLPAMKKWKEKGMSIGVYSSGSVKAQHLIFEYSVEGNLRNFFSHHFDTSVGHKREIQSYGNIVTQLQLNAADILFLSDIKEELDAARAAGMKTIQLIRQSDVIAGDHQTAETFLDITV